MSRFATVLALLLAAAAVQADERLVGTWELVGLSRAVESDPRGRSNLKTRYGPDGTAVFVRPDATLAAGTVGEARWTLEDGRLTLALEGGRTVSADVEFASDEEMVLAFAGRPRERHRRLGGPEAIDRRIEPGSLHATFDARSFAAATSAGTVAEIVEPVPTVAGPTSGPVAERLIGVWEVIAHRGAGDMALPPGGFENDLYAFDEGALEITIRIMEPGGPPPMPWAVEDGTLVLTGPGGERFPFGEVSFDGWGHLAIDTGSGQGTMVLRRVSLDPATVPEVARGVAVLEPGR